MSDEFDFGARIGMLFVVEAAAASALAVTSLLLYIAVTSDLHSSDLAHCTSPTVQCCHNQAKCFTKVVHRNTRTLLFPQPTYL